MNDLAIRASHISKTIKNRKIIDDVDIDLQRGHIYALLGRNGAGKTTIVRLLTGLLHQTGGDITLLGRRLDRKNAYEIRRRISIQSDGSTYEEMSVGQNIRFYMDIYDRFDKDVFHDILTRFNLMERKDDKVKELSKGNRQKVLIAQALSVSPELLFLDEPTSGLDPETSDSLMGELHALSRNQRLSVFMCTHRLQGLNGFIDDAGFLENGHMADSGNTDELLRKYYPYDAYVLRASGPVGTICRADGLADVENIGDGVYNLAIRVPPERIVAALVANDCGIYEFTKINHSIHDLYYKVLHE